MGVCKRLWIEVNRCRRARAKNVAVRKSIKVYSNCEMSVWKYLDTSREGIVKACVMWKRGGWWGVSAFIFDENVSATMRVKEK